MRSLVYIFAAFSLFSRCNAMLPDGYLDTVLHHFKYPEYPGKQQFQKQSHLIQSAISLPMEAVRSQFTKWTPIQPGSTQNAPAFVSSSNS